MAEPILLAVPTVQIAKRTDDDPHEPESLLRRTVTTQSAPKGRQPLFRR